MNQKKKSRSAKNKPAGSERVVSLPPQSHIKPVDERMKAGKLLRERCPLKIHGDWKPFAQRVDPIDLLIENSRGRVEELIPIRYGRMMANPFAFPQGKIPTLGYGVTYTVGNVLLALWGAVIAVLLPHGKHKDFLSVGIFLDVARLEAAKARLLAMPVFQEGGDTGEIALTLSISVTNDLPNSAKFYLKDVSAGGDLPADESVLEIPAGGADTITLDAITQGKLMQGELLRNGCTLSLRGLGTQQC